MPLLGILLAMMLFDPAASLGRQLPLPTRRTLTLEAARPREPARSGEARNLSRRAPASSGVTVHSDFDGKSANRRKRGQWPRGRRA